jgi:ankyrin repeat protein
MKQTPLIRAAMKGFVEIMRILLTKGADPLSRDENNHDAMDICETAGFSAGVELLEEYFLLEGIVRVKDEDIIVIDDIEEL